MRNELEAEVDRLKSLLQAVHRQFPLTDGATEQQLARVGEVTQINVSGDLADFYRYSNGSHREEVFAVFTDEETPCEFLSIADALQSWGVSLSNLDEFYTRLNASYAGYQEDPPRDRRIRPDIWMNKNWFPFAEFNGGATRVFWDSDPATGGTIGQIIVYQHDPDAIYYVAPDFLSFLKKSNDMLEANPRQLLEGIYD
jgi:cell wall assembly regulator SMI1